MKFTNYTLFYFRESSFLQDDESLPHHNENLWFAKDFSRTDAMRVLTGKPDGTFLIRNSRTPGQYALSIVYVVNYLFIFKCN